MKKISYKYKISILAIVWLVISAIFFGFGFSYVNNNSQAKVTDILELKKEQLELQEEQKSFQLGKKDLDTLREREIQPENFFSLDTNLVKEVSVLEELAAVNDVELTLGLSGKSSTLKKAETVGDLLEVPYSLQLEGSYPNVLNFIASAEKLNFITHFRTLSMLAITAGKVNASISALFYIKVNPETSNILN